MACGCQSASGVGRIQDLSYASLMPHYAASGFGDDETPIDVAPPTTGQIIGMTAGWIALGGLCGAALFVFGQELLSAKRGKI